MRRKLSLFSLLIVLVIALMSTIGVAANGESPLKVAASTSLIADVAQAVGGDLVEVIAIIPPGADSHTYTPSPRDVIAIVDADVVLVNGMELEENLLPVIEENASVEPVIVSMGVRIISTERGHGHHHDHEHGNDHMHDTYIGVLGVDAVCDVEPHHHEHDHDHGHDHDHDHGHDHDHEHGDDHDHEHGDDHDHEHGDDHDHEHADDHDHEHADDHGHEHDHDHGHEHDHEHGHGDDHDHEHGDDHDHEHADDHGHEHDHEHGHGDDHDHEHADDHDHEHADDHGHDHGHGHGHDHDHDHDHDHGPCDPHVWYDPANVMIWANNIAAAFAEADPDHAEIYAANAQVYIAELEALIEEIAEQIASVPEENRVLVTNHDFLAYFAVPHGFEVVGTVIPAATTLAEVAPSDIIALVETIREYNVPAIFAEYSVSTDIAETVAREVGRDVAVVRLFSESLSAADGPAATYIDYMRYNISAIVTALGGSAG